jgi:Transposase DDE domain
MTCCPKSTGNFRPKVYISRPAKSASWMPPLSKRSRPRNGKDGENTQDSEAGYSVKVAANGKKTSTYGYKAHVNVDEDGFIKAVDYTSGNEHDSQSLEKLLTGAEEQVYADCNDLIKPDTSRGRFIMS